MIKHKISILGISLLMFAASCKKTDVLHKEQGPKTDAVAAKSNAAAGSTEWTSPAIWNATKATGFTTYSTSINDPSITNEVLQSGMILVYLKNGNSGKSLPFKHKEGVEQYWYYQAAKNHLQINSDAYTTEAVNINNSFKYFVLSKEKISELQKSGTSKLQLMTLTYENAEMILK